MIKHNYLQKDYTTNGIEKQLKIPFEIELKIEKSDPVMLLSQYVEEMDLTDLYSTYERIRENQATPRQLLKSGNTETAFKDIAIRIYESGVFEQSNRNKM